LQCDITEYKESNGVSAWLAAVQQSQAPKLIAQHEIKKLTSRSSMFAIANTVIAIEGSHSEELLERFRKAVVLSSPENVIDLKFLAVSAYSDFHS
jgi:hypothetical protein